MNGYQDWRLTLRLLAPLGTPWQSDTLFGHLCWQVALREGEAAVGEFLDPFRRGEPPFVLSDGFPAGLLPRPLLPRRPEPPAGRAEYAARRQLEKAPFLGVEDFLALVRGDTQHAEPRHSPWQTVKVPHAAIDRRLDTTGGGDGERAGGFFETQLWALSGEPRLQVYLRTLPAWKQRVLALLEQLSRSGFGRDKSVGCGAFCVEAVEPWAPFGPFDGADAFVSLSTYMPAAADPIEGRWRLRIKRGYLGEHAGGHNPYKRPLVQFVPGAVFVTRAGLRPYYGRVVPQVAPGLPAAVQCGYALPVPCRWRSL